MCPLMTPVYRNDLYKYSSQAGVTYNNAVGLEVRTNIIYRCEFSGEGSQDDEPCFYTLNVTAVCCAGLGTSQAVAE